MNIRGICSVCGCTFEDPCIDPFCSWADDTQTICTNCVSLSADEREASRKNGIDYLRADLERIKAENNDVRLRLKVLKSSQPQSKPGGRGRRKSSQAPYYSKRRRR